MNLDHNEELERARLKDRNEAAQQMVNVVESCLDLKRWGFHQTFANIIVEKPPHVIYDSDWCRVMFTSGGWDPQMGNVMNIYYGRLHATNEGGLVIWNGQVCHCWHDINNMLNFLDGISPQEAVEQLYMKGALPSVMQQFRQTEFGKSLSRRQSEWIAKMHDVVWDYYGMRLFEVFDLHRPELWAQYTRFITEFHKRKKLALPTLGDLNPPDDRIC